MVNVIATIAGRRADRVALASHYDTKRAPNFRFVGANDGGSSTAAVLELARALKDSQPEFTIELLLLDGEEAVNWDWAGTDNTYGSRHYVSAGQADGSLKGLKALVLLDMVGDVEPGDPPRVAVHAVAGGRGVVRRRARGPAGGVLQRADHRRGRPRRRSCAPACPPWTSSTSTTPPGTRRRTTWRT